MSVRILIALLVLTVASAGCLQNVGQKVGLGDAPPDPYVAPTLSEATIRPGMRLGEPGFCTVNFLFLDRDGGTVYIGTAAHCVSENDAPLGQTNTDGCDPQNRPFPMGAALSMQGAQHSVVLVYSSWATMQAEGERSATICQNNDFALLRLHPDDAERAHPAMLGYGGPTGLASDVAPGDVIYSYGASEAAPRPEDADARQGLILQAAPWRYETYQATPAIPGDSGSPVVRADGGAVGVLVTFGLTPLPASNGVMDLAHAMDYAQEKTPLQFTLLTAPTSGAIGAS